MMTGGLSSVPPAWAASAEMTSATGSWFISSKCAAREVPVASRCSGQEQALKSTIICTPSGIEVNHHFHYIGTSTTQAVSLQVVHAQLDKMLVQAVAVLSCAAKQLLLLHSDMSVLRPMVCEI